MKTNRLMLIAGAMLLVAGCKREEGIRAYDAPKDPPPGKFVMKANPAETDQGGENAQNIQWTAPPSWKKVAAGQMNYAAYQVSEDPPIKVTISQITAAGTPAATLLANVKRWEGQLGLPPSSEADLGKVVTAIKVGDRDAQLIDLIGPTAPAPRMLAGMVPDGDRIWVFKMVGPSEAVAVQKPVFEELVKSARFGEAEATTPAEPSAAASIPGIASMALPEGWKIDPTPRAMRAGTILVSAGGEQAEIAVTRLGAASLGDLQANINRWRGTVKLPPTTDTKAHPPQVVSLAQGPGMILDFAGPDSEGAARKRLLVGIAQFPNSDEVWFFRLLGPHDLVAKSKPAFEGFVQSIKFDDK